MKLIIDIPKEFETDYRVNKFKDFFTRVSFAIEKVDGLYGLCGNYEKEIAEMFLKAFDESVLMANIVENIVTSLESEKNVFLGTRTEQTDTILIDDAISIIKQEINNGLE